MPDRANIRTAVPGAATASYIQFMMAKASVMRVNIAMASAMA